MKITKYPPISLPKCPIDPHPKGESVQDALHGILCTLEGRNSITQAGVGGPVHTANAAPGHPSPAQEEQAR